MRFGNVDFVNKEGVAWITLDDPDRFNARSPEIRQGLRESLAQVEADDSIRVAVLTGRGDKAFCAGGDISRFSFEAHAARKFSKETLALTHSLEACSKPVIAAVNGLALGGGFELAMACDFVIASDRAQFGLPEIRLGLMPGFAVVRLHEIVGRSRAKELAMLGEPISADEALRLGVVLRVVPHAQLLEEAGAFAQKLAAKPRTAISMIKGIFNRGLGGDELQLAMEAMPVLFVTEDAREGITAFREKRKPQFKT
ncbi:MAG: enoyl-CoA hydratase-related protein [Burkholderiaceae bacterium]|nr:enoyl-CoA hydratase-related protein [Burkholderiaceae bacterium]MDO9091000.1 enoyl-CoA hydratase-related protein [Burkholderiaceae bacterium]MDP1968630.1 enoyl-CoA hydratase-related protein [Burkholderiaceae bacterium]